MTQATYKRHYDPRLVAFVERLASLPSGPQRWRLAMEFWLRKNEIIETPTGPLTAQEYNALQIKHNEAIRAEQQNKFAAIEDGTMRFGLSIPDGMWAMIKLCDPGAFTMAHGNDRVVRDNLKAFMDAFPQYRIAEKY
jgi:hypothetical protein